MPDEITPARPRKGPLAGLKIIELAGIGPAPMCAMVLADAGAEVLRIDRPNPSGLGIEKPVRFDLLARSRRSVAINLKHPDGIGCVLDLVAQADALIEGFRPGTMERLGLGPEVCLKLKPSLVNGRITGWGQTGPLAAAAGHDLNYIALSGALHAIGRAGAPPTPPLNLVGDFGGGAMYLAFGILAALLHARATGEGQVVDAAMVEGAANLMTSFYGLHGAGLQNDERGTNVLDSGAPYCEVYECADGRYLSVAPIEAKFRDVLFTRIGLGGADLPDLRDPSNWRRASVRRPGPSGALSWKAATPASLRFCRLLRRRSIPTTGSARASSQWTVWSSPLRPPASRRRPQLCPRPRRRRAQARYSPWRIGVSHPSASRHWRTRA